MQKNILRRRQFDFIDMLDGDGKAALTAELADEDDDEEFLSGYLQFVPIDMYGMPLREMDNIVYPVCRLCRDHEKAGFIEGIRLGVLLAQELTEVKA